MEVELADADQSQIVGKEIPHSQSIPKAWVRKRNANYWIQFGGHI